VSTAVSKRAGFRWQFGRARALLSTRRMRWSGVLLAALFAVAGCANGVGDLSGDDPRGPHVDGGHADSGRPRDGGGSSTDMGRPDLGPPDLGPPDLGPPDLGWDAGPCVFGSGGAATCPAGSRCCILTISTGNCTPSATMCP
jgi:hypothetical protein